MLTTWTVNIHHLIHQGYVQKQRICTCVTSPMSWFLVGTFFKNKSKQEKYEKTFVNDWAKHSCSRCGCQVWFPKISVCYEGRGDGGTGVVFRKAKMCAGFPQSTRGVHISYIYICVEVTAQNHTQEKSFKKYLLFKILGGEYAGWPSLRALCWFRTEKIRRTSITAKQRLLTSMSSDISLADDS